MRVNPTTGEWTCPRCNADNPALNCRCYACGFVAAHEVPQPHQVKKGLVTIALILIAYVCLCGLISVIAQFFSR